MSELLHFAEHRLQEAALVFMGLVYTARLFWITRRKAGRERQAPTGTGSVGSKTPIVFSMGIIAQPWAMESTRSNRFLYVQFVIFHLGVVAAIGLSFVIPYAPSLLGSSSLVLLLQIVMGAAFLVGVGRIVRRIASPYMRAISSPDDYFSLVLLTVWFAFAFLAAPNDINGGEGFLLTYFFLTAFFLIYVPFSKISHYLYYPFTRYFLGKTFGRRGVYPVKQASHGLNKAQ